MTMKFLAVLALFFLGHSLSFAHGQNHNCNTRRYFYAPQVPIVYYFPLEAIPVDVVRADGVRLHDGRTTRIMFYLGRCRNGDIWCQAGVTPARFRTEDEALRWVEEMMDLVPMSIRQIDRRSAGPSWFISN